MSEQTETPRKPGVGLAVLVIVCVVIALIAIANRRAPKPPAEGKATAPVADASGLSGTLTVLVPCGQINPFMHAQRLFRDKHPNVKIEITQENIDVLRAKVLDGKVSGADVFLDMGDTAVRELVKAGRLISGTEVAYAQNYLALIVPAGNPAGIKTIPDLGNPKVHAIGLAEPTENSNGEYAVEALRKAGLWDQLEKAGKIVTTKQPAELKPMVGQKKVDAAFIYAPCVHEQPKGEDKPATGPPKKTELVGNVPDDLYTPFYCTAAVMTGTDNEAAARALVEFLETDEASEIFQEWYFGPPKSKAKEKAEALLVHCGAGIRPPMDELAELFQQRTGTRVDVSYKGSGCLLADIEFSRKGDLYMPGEMEYMDQAKAKGFLVNAQPAATMTTVIVTPKGKQDVQSLQDLAKPGLKVGLGSYPEVAVGVAAKKVLDKAGLWEAVQKNVTVGALNVVELANSVKIGALDAAIVWDATAHLVKDDVRIVQIDPKYSYKTTVLLGTLKFTRHPDKAQSFMDLVCSREGADIFRKHGYGTVAPTGA